VPIKSQIGRDADAVQFRMLDGINALRAAAGAQPVKLSAQLNAAAETHSQDMSVQNRPWHFGSDGSSPIDRAQRVGYTGRLLGENISETFETELQTLSAWMEQPETRGVILDARASDLGFAWFQEPSGKIWWTLVLQQVAKAASSMNEYVAARIPAQRFGLGDVSFGRVIEPQRQVKSGVRVTAIDIVMPFWRLSVSGNPFVAYWREPE